MANISKETFDKLAKEYGQRKQAAGDYTYGFDAGVAYGVEVTLYTIYGYDYSDKLDKDVSVAQRVKERAEELTEEWTRTDANLNGRYTMFGKLVQVERGYDNDTRVLKAFESTWDGACERKYVANDAVAQMRLSDILVKYVEPTLDELLTLPDLEPEGHGVIEVTI